MWCHRQVGIAMLNFTLGYGLAIAHLILANVSVTMVHVMEYATPYFRLSPSYAVGAGVGGWWWALIDLDLSRWARRRIGGARWVGGWVGLWVWVGGVGLGWVV